MTSLRQRMLEDMQVRRLSARGEDMVGEAARVGVLFAVAPPGLVHQEPVEDVGGFVGGGRDGLRGERGEPVGDATDLSQPDRAGRAPAGGGQHPTTAQRHRAPVEVAPLLVSHLRITGTRDSPGSFCRSRDKSTVCCLRCNREPLRGDLARHLGLSPPF